MNIHGLEERLKTLAQTNENRPHETATNAMAETEERVNARITATLNEQEGRISRLIEQKLTEYMN